MELLIKYSGLISAAFATIFIALSASLAKYNRNKFPISWTGTPHFWCIFFNSGAVLSGIFQFIYIFFLSTIFNSNLGVPIYATGAISCILIGLFTYNRHRRLHDLFAGSFFLLNSIGGFIFSLSLLATNPNLAITSATLAVLELVCLLSVFKIFKEIAFAELLAILFSSFWAISFYLVK